MSQKPLKPHLFEKAGPEEIAEAISNDRDITPLQIQWMIKRYGDRQARDAVQGMAKGLGVSLEKEIEEALERINKMIDEFLEKSTKGEFPT